MTREESSESTRNTQLTEKVNQLQDDRARDERMNNFFSESLPGRAEQLQGLRRS